MRLEKARFYAAFRVSQLPIKTYKMEVVFTFCQPNLKHTEILCK